LRLHANALALRGPRVQKTENELWGEGGLPFFSRREAQAR